MDLAAERLSVLWCRKNCLPPLTASAAETFSLLSFSNTQSGEMPVKKSLVFASSTVVPVQGLSTQAACAQAASSKKRPELNRPAQQKPNRAFPCFV